MVWFWAQMALQYFIGGNGKGDEWKQKENSHLFSRQRRHNDDDDAQVNPGGNALMAAWLTNHDTNLQAKTDSI